jgi:hypothetical protein
MQATTVQDTRASDPEYQDGRGPIITRDTQPSCNRCEVEVFGSRVPPDARGARGRCPNLLKGDLCEGPKMLACLLGAWIAGGLERWQKGD